MATSPFTCTGCERRDPFAASREGESKGRKPRPVIITKMHAFLHQNKKKKKKFFFVVPHFSSRCGSVVERPRTRATEPRSIDTATRAVSEIRFVSRHFPKITQRSSRCDCARPRAARARSLRPDQKARPPRLEHLEERTLLAVTLTGIPSFIPQGPGPIVGGQSDVHHDEVAGSGQRHPRARFRITSL